MTPPRIGLAASAAAPIMTSAKLQSPIVIMIPTWNATSRIKAAKRAFLPSRSPTPTKRPPHIAAQVSSKLPQGLWLIAKKAVSKGGETPKPRLHEFGAPDLAEKTVGHLSMFAERKDLGSTEPYAEQDEKGYFHLPR